MLQANAAGLYPKAVRLGRRVGRGGDEQNSDDFVIPAGRHLEIRYRDQMRAASQSRCGSGFTNGLEVSQVVFERRHRVPNVAGGTA